MRIAAIWADGTGESHYRDIDVELKDSGPLGRTSELLPATGLILRENEAGYDYSWHPAPRRQYIVMLAGFVEITVSDGEIRTFGPGEILLVEDTAGKGHKSRSPDGEPRRSIFLPLP